MRARTLRPAIVGATLGLTVVLAAILAAQAAFAARNHRVIAEGVLRDYAMLGADGVAQRFKATVGGRFSTVLSDIAAMPSGERVTVAALRSKLSGGPLEAIDDSSRILHVRPGDSLAASLRAATAGLPSYAYFGMKWIPLPRGSELLVFQPVRDTAGSVAAFTMPARGAAAMFSRILAKDPVLPAGLTRGAPVRPGVGLRLSRRGDNLAELDFDSATPFRANAILDQQYDSLRIDVSLGESLAPTLVIGGLPRSRLPLLLALLLVTVALTIAAGDQIRRELELSRLRDDFVSSVSHELRTPLAQIRMFAETLRLGRVRTAEEGERSLAIVENEARRLEHLVENLLHFSRAERGALQIHAQPTNVTSLLQDIVGEFAPLAARGASRIELALQPDVRVDVDPAAIRQIVLNLLDNAVKYGRQGQVITVGLLATATEVQISVQDQGVGIAPEDRPFVWNRFWRGSAARRDGVTGTGVGLAITRDLIQLHGGSGTIEDSAGTGARIVVRLPRTTP